MTNRLFNIRAVCELVFLLSSIFLLLFCAFTVKCNYTVIYFYCNYKDAADWLTRHPATNLVGLDNPVKAF